MEDKGHVWLGCDVSRDMIDVANERIDHKREVAAAMRNKGNGEEDEEMDGDSGEEDGDGCRLASTGDLLHQVRIRFLFHFAVYTFYPGLFHDMTFSSNISFL